MKILVIGGYISVNKRGGAGYVVWEICKAMADTDEVYWLPLTSIPDLFTLFRRNSKESSVNIIYKKLPLSIISKNYIKEAAQAISKYVSKPNKKNYYTLIYAYGKAFCEYVISKLKPDVIHIHGFTMSSYPFFTASLDKGIPVVGTVHGLLSFNKDIKIEYDRSLESYLMKKLIEKGGSITSVSSDDQNTIIKKFDIPFESVHVILNGVDLQRFQSNNTSKNELREKYNFPTKKKILLQVATLSKRKNHIAVLNALVHMRNKHKIDLIYMIVGDGPERENLEAYVKENGLTKNVMFIGALYGAKLIEFYHLSDYFILPSTSEGLPLVYLEAMAAGLPIITFKDLQGVGDIYNPDCMELIQRRSTDGIINAIELATAKHWDIETIIANAQNYSWDHFGKEYLKLYDSVVKNQCAQLKVIRRYSMN